MKSSDFFQKIEVLAGKSSLITLKRVMSMATVDKKDELIISRLNFCFIVQLANSMLKNLNADQKIFFPFMKMSGK